MAHKFDVNTTAEEVVQVLGDSIRGKNVLLIGATLQSMGAEFLRVLAPYPKTIWVAGRDTSKVQAAVDAALEPIKGTKPAVHIVQLDLVDFASVRKAAEQINAQGEPIDVLLQNAAIPWYTDIHRNAQGYEAQFAGNHLGPFLLVSLLLPRLRQAGPGARVVIISSIVHTYPVKPRWDDPNYIKRPEEYNTTEPYHLSKLANVLFTRELAKRLAPEGILAYSLHPGLVFTNGLKTSAKESLVRIGVMNADATLSATSPLKPKSLSAGVAGYFVAAFDPALKSKSGGYLNDDLQLVPDENMVATVTDETAKNLWTMSEELLDIKFL